MARDDDRERIAAGGGAGSARFAGKAGELGELRVADRLAETHSGDRLPDRALKRCALRRKCDVEALTFPPKVLRELAPCLRDEAVVIVAPPLRIDRGVIFLALEIDARQAGVVRDEQHLPAGTCVETIALHVRSSVNDCHRCMT